MGGKKRETQSCVGKKRKIGNLCEKAGYCSFIQEKKIPCVCSWVCARYSQRPPLRTELAAVVAGQMGETGLLPLSMAPISFSVMWPAAISGRGSR